MTNSELLNEISNMSQDELDKVNVYSLIKNRAAQEKYWDIQKIIIVVSGAVAGLGLMLNFIAQVIKSTT